MVTLTHKNETDMLNWLFKKKKDKTTVHKASGSINGVAGGVDISGRTEADFTALKNFDWVTDDGVLVAQYVEGMVYRKRKGNAILQHLLPIWEAEGKVKTTKSRR